MYQLGFLPPALSTGIGSTNVGSLDRDAAVADVLSRLGARRSAWNAADARGEVEQYIARSRVVADGSVRRELAEHLTAMTVTGCARLLDRDDVPEHVRALTSPRVLAVEREIVARLSRRAVGQVFPARVHELHGNATRREVLHDALKVK